MKKRFFLIIVTLLFVITLGACNLDNREVEIAASVSFNPEMVEETAQQVKVEVAEQDLTNLEITYKGLNPEIAEISSTGLIKAHAPGEAEFEIEIVADEAKKEISFKVIVKALEYTISYELNGGENSELNPAGFVKSDLPLALQPATKAGYKFAGWELEGEVVEALPEGTTRNVTLVATWELENYAISYDLAGGEHAGEVAATYTILDEVVLGEATKEGYTFLGWYVGEEKIEKIEAGSTGEVALSAKWEAVEYTISYDLVGGAHVGEAVTTYTILDEVVLGKAEKENEEFLGWFLNGELVEVIPAGTTGNIELVAKWQPKSYSITYVLDGGKLEGGYATFEEIGKDFLADFNKYGNCELGAAEFASESHPEVKQALASLEMLTKWQWYFEFMLEDLKSIHGDTTNSYVTETYSVLEKIIALDTTAIEISGNARTLIRYYSGGMMQGIKGSEGNPTFAALCADFSETARQEALLKAGSKGLSYTPEEEVVLPIPTKEGYTFLGWYNAAGEKQEKIEKGTTGDLVFTAKWESEVKVESEIEYVLDGGVLPEGAKSTYVEGEGLSTLPVPTKEGYKFLGWYQGENKVEAISSEATGKVTLTAKWEKNADTPIIPEPPVEGTVLEVGEGKTYATIADAMAVAKAGDTIKLSAGTYEAAEITVAGITLAGPNAGVNPNKDARSEEAIFVGDLLVSANNIVIDGIYLTEKGRIVGNEKGVSSIVIKNVEIKASTVNPTSSDSATAPFMFASAQQGAEFVNIQIDQVKNTESKGRPMILFGAQVNGLSITNSTFIAIGGNYNDGVKLSKAGNYVDAAYGIKGEVEIKGNHFENYMQYVLWFNNYQEGNYVIANNTFKNCGQTAGSHAAATFNTYSGSADGKASIAFTHNTVDNSYSLLRLDKNTVIAEANFAVNVNYNKLYKCAATYYVNNKNTYNIDATNNWYDQAPVASKFLGATWEPYYADENEVPEYVEKENAYKITYVLNGGVFGSVSYETTIEGAPASEVEIGAYYSDGLEPAAPIVICEPSIVSKNSLRWQYKVLLQYSEKLNAYEVVAVDGATAGIKAVAEAAGVTWTHALNSTQVKVNEQFSVGQLLVIDAVVAEGMQAVKAQVYAPEQIKSTEVKNEVEAPETYTSKELPLTLPVPTLAGKEFYGWYQEENFSGERLFQIPAGTYGDITLYARFVEPGWVEPTFGKVSFELNGGLTDAQLPTEYQFGTEIELPVLEKEGYIFLGWTVAEDGTDYMKVLSASIKEENLVLYAQFALDAVYVGEGKDYATIAEALAAAEEGTTIVLSAATFAEDIEISKNGIRIIGTTVDSVVSTLNSIKINAKNVVIDGVKLTAAEAVVIAGGENITIKNSFLGGTPTADNQAVVAIKTELKGFNLLDCEIVETSSRTHYRAVLSEAVISDVTIRGNLFKQDCDTSVYIDCVKLTKISGHITIEDNEFDWPGDNFTVYMGSQSVAAGTVVNMNNNVFKCAAPMSGVSIRGLNATSTVNMIGNTFENVKGTVIQVRGTGTSDTTTETTVNIKNNALISTSTKISISVALTNVSIDNNYFFQDIVWSNSDASSKTTNNAQDAQSALAGIKTHKVEFVTNGGAIYGDVPASFIEGTELNVESIIPTLDGMRLVGWYKNADFSGEKVTVLSGETADVVLYAKYEAIPVYKVEYVLDGGEAEGLVFEAYEGTVIELPVPTRFGATFLGWSTEQGSLVYVTSIELTANTTVYANWTTAEVYEVTYVLNGGSIRYASREELVNDFIKDYSYAMNKSYKTGDDIPTGSFAEIDYHTFYTKTLEDGTPVRDKWLWLAEHIYELSVRDLASNNCNVLGLKALINNSTYSGDAIYGISYAFRAFLIGTTIRPGTGYTSVDFSIYENANSFWDALSKTEPTTYKYYGETLLPQAYSGQYNFIGWYDNAEFSGEALTKVSEAVTLYAKFAEGNPVQSVTITNKVTELVRYETLQLTWELNPTDATIQTVKFESSDPTVATVDSNGLITALTNGTVTIKIISQGEGNKSDEFTFEVYSPDHFESEYVGESYIEVGGTTELASTYVKRDGTTEKLVWLSITPELATVDENGVVKGVASGLATIRVALESNKDIYQDLYVTVLEAELSEALQFVVDEHESNVFTRYELGIGSGTPAYYADIYGSVNQFLYNKQLEINTYYLAAGNASGDYYANSNKEGAGLQFVTVHYTAGMDATADTDNHASYFTSGSADVSIHYVTGNAGNGSSGGTENGTAEVYQTLDHAHGAWHAGDSGAYSRVGAFDWLPTGVAYDDCDLLEVKFTASVDFYYEINGKKTNIKLPDTYNFTKNGVERHTDHIYNADGTISAQPDYNNWGTTFANREPESFFNDQGFPITVINGEYYMGKTWWSYGQVYEGRICGSGGNRNSIGIESCVNKGSDLWYTWQITAKLVAKLLYENNLGVERVKGHHFFDGKDCPQPLLENNLEIWWEFIELVQAELEVLQEYSDYEMEFVSNNPDIINEHGRVIEAPKFGTSVTYTVNITKDGKTETITLASMVPGIYEKAE